MYRKNAQTLRHRQARALPRATTTTTRRIARSRLQSESARTSRRDFFGLFCRYEWQLPLLARTENDPLSRNASRHFSNPQSPATGGAPEDHSGSGAPGEALRRLRRARWRLLLGGLRRPAKHRRHHRSVEPLRCAAGAPAHLAARSRRKPQQRPFLPPARFLFMHRLLTEQSNDGVYHCLCLLFIYYPSTRRASRCSSGGTCALGCTLGSSSS